MTTITSDNHDPETFDGIVRTIPISNRDFGNFSMDTSNCYIGINIIENKINKFSHEIPLFWLRGNQLPTRCNVGSSLVGNREIREQYADELAFAYLGALTHITSTRAPLSKGIRDELLFLFTFPETRFVYLLPPLTMTQDMMSYFSLNFNKAYDVKIRFYSNEYNQTNTKHFRFIARAWDDILLEENYIAWFHSKSHYSAYPLL